MQACSIWTKRSHTIAGALRGVENVTYILVVLSPLAKLLNEGVLTSRISIRRIGCERFGAWVRVPLQGAAGAAHCRAGCRAGCCCQSALRALLWALVLLAGCWCRCRVLLQCAAVTVLCAFGWCRCRAPPEGAAVRVLCALENAIACCRHTFCYLEPMLA